jgi:hypothetical protein
MTYSTTSEVSSQIEIASHWRPILDAVGCDTRGWSPWDLWRLAPLVLKDPAVDERRREKRDQWQQQHFHIYGTKLADFLPPEHLLLAAISELPDAIKKEIRARIEGARVKK